MLSMQVVSRADPSLWSRRKDTAQHVDVSLSEQSIILEIMENHVFKTAKSRATIVLRFFNEKCHMLKIQ